VKRDALTNNQTNKLLLNTKYNREEKKGNEGSSAKKRDIAAIDGVSSESVPKRSKKDVSKMSDQSQYRRVRNTVNLRIRVSNYSPLKHYTSKLPTIPEE